MRHVNQIAIDILYAIMGGHIRVVTPEGKAVIEELRLKLTKKGVPLI